MCSTNIKKCRSKWQNNCSYTTSVVNLHSWCLIKYIHKNTSCILLAFDIGQLRFLQRIYHQQEKNNQNTRRETQIFASVQNSAPNSVFVFGRIVSSKQIRIVSLYVYSATSDIYVTQSVPAALAQTAWFLETNERERVMARQHADMEVISKGHKKVVNIRTAGAASKRSAGNAIGILIRPNSSQNCSYSAE